MDMDSKDSRAIKLPGTCAVHKHSAIAKVCIGTRYIMISHNDAWCWDTSGISEQWLYSYFYSNNQRGDVLVYEISYGYINPSGEQSNETTVV